jgi:hypothetical protein
VSTRIFEEDGKPTCKRRNVTEVEDQIVAKLDGFVEKLVLGHHCPSDEIPCSPKLMPLRQSRKWIARILTGLICEREVPRREQMEFCVSQPIFTRDVEIFLR